MDYIKTHFIKNTFFFKSNPSNFEKESKNIKNNTLRVMSFEELTEVEEVWKSNTDLKICIENTHSHEVFIRELKDVSALALPGTWWGVIFTWKIK